MNFKDLLTETNITTSHSKIKIDLLNLEDYSQVDFSVYDAFLLGYLEDRNSQNIGANDASNKIRAELFQLFSTSKQLKVLDLGNCKLGNKVKDSYFVLQETLKLVKVYKKPILIIGGTQEATYSISKECFDSVSFPTLTCIDSKLDIDTSIEDFSNTNYLLKVAHKFPKVRIVNIANQENLSSKLSFEWFKQNYYPLYRLGKVFSQRILAEPLIRDAQLVSFDVSSIRFSDFPASTNSNPIGLYAEDACQLAWYSGFSQKCEVFFLSEFNPTIDINNISAKLSAQIIWHVLDGISQRKLDSMDFSTDSFKKYFVKNDFLTQDLPFYESFASQNIWVEVPLKNKKKKRILPCSSVDYKDFMSGNLPEYWMLEFNRLYKKS